MTTKKTDSWLIKNAIGCFLHYYPDHEWAARYKELVKIDKFTTTQPKKRSQSPRARKPDATNGKN